MQLRLVWIVITLGIFLLFEKKDVKAGETTPKANKKKKGTAAESSDAPPAATKPAPAPTEVLGGSLRELGSRLKLAFPNHRETQAAAFYLLAVSLGKAEWRARPVGMWNKLLLQHLKKVGEQPAKGLLTIQQMEEDGLVVKVMLAEKKVGYRPAWPLIKALLPAEEDMGFELALDDDATVVAEEGEEVVILDEETTEFAKS